MKAIYTLPNIKSEFSLSMRLALPLIAMEIIYALNGFLGAMMAARLGKEQLAANALVWSIYLSIIVVAAGSFCSIGIMTAQSFGAKDNKGITSCFKQGLILAILAAFPMMFLMWAAPVILTWTKQDPEVIRYATPFFRSLTWLMIPFNIFVIFEQFLVGLGKTRLVMLLTIMSVPVGILFYYLLLFGKFGFPAVGLAGIGYGLAIANSLMVIYCLIYLNFSKELKIYALFDKWWVVEKKFLFEMIRVGLPIGFMWCSELVFFAVVALMMGVLGTTTLAAHQIAYQYFMLALFILFGLTQSTAMRVGNEVGRNNRDKLKLAATINIAIGLGFMSIFSVFYLFAPQTAINLGIDPALPNLKETVEQAVKFFPIVAVLLISDGIRIISCGALRGIKDTYQQALISVFGFWVIALPTAYFLAFKLGLGGRGIWWGMVAGFSVTGVLFMVRFYRLANSSNLAALVTKKD